MGIGTIDLSTEVIKVGKGVYYVDADNQRWGTSDYWALVLQRAASWVASQLRLRKGGSLTVKMPRNKGKGVFLVRLHSERQIRQLIRRLRLGDVVDPQRELLIIEREDQPFVHSGKRYLSANRWSEALSFRPRDIATGTLADKDEWLIAYVQSRGEVVTLIPSEIVMRHLAAKDAELRRQIFWAVTTPGDLN